MYHPTNLKLSDARLERFRQLATCVDIAPGPGGSRMSERKATEEVFGPDLASVIPPPWSYVTVVALYPGAQIQAHADAPITGVRHHIPLDLNAGCWVFSDGTWQQLEEGRVYVMDPSLPHGAVNWGATRRLHLLVDRA